MFVPYKKLKQEEKIVHHRNIIVTESSLLLRRKKQTSFFLNSCCVMAFYEFLCRSVCWFLYGPFWHGALKLDISTLFTTVFLWTYLQFILTHNPADKFDDVFSLKILFLVWLTRHLRLFCSFATLVELFKICKSSANSIRSFCELRGTLNKIMHVRWTCKYIFVKVCHYQYWKETTNIYMVISTWYLVSHRRKII